VIKRFLGGVRKLWREYGWPLAGGLALAAFLLGTIGFARHAAATGEKSSLSDVLYLSLQLFVLQSGSVAPPVNWELDLARWLAPLATAYTAVSALMVIFAEKLRSFRLRFLKNHVVICGLGEKGHRLAQGFHDAGERVVVIEKDEGNSRLEQCRTSTALKILLGSAPDAELLGRARAGRAKCVIAVCGEDGDNAEIARCVGQLARGRTGRPVLCLVHISNLELYYRCRERALSTGGDGAVRLEFFNVYDAAARRLLNEFPLAGPDGSAGAKPHIAIVGCGAIAQALVSNAAAAWAERFAETGERLPLTLVRPAGAGGGHAPCGPHTLSSQVCEVGVLACEFEEGGLETVRLPDDVTTIYVCLEDDAETLSAGLSLRRLGPGRTLRTVLCVKEKTGLAMLLGRDGRDGRPENMHVFGILDRTCDPDLLPGGIHETLARLLHEDYVQAQVRMGKAPASSPSLVAWDELGEEFRESSRLEADYIAVKLEAVDCEIEPLTEWDAERFKFSGDEIETMASMEHERYRSERFLARWRYGPARDDDARTNPNLAPWEELPENVREYSREAVRKLPAFLAKAALQVCRLR
jgi:hypothetical protein